jgi:hypothetical protein
MAYNAENAKKVLQALTSAGAPLTVVPFLMAQVAHETGTFNSRVFVDNNNASGIMFINNPTRQKNATRGRAFPRNEWPAADKPLYYANYATLKDWAVDYLRIVGKTVQAATTLDQYAVALKNRKYYTAPTAAYAAALRAHYTKLQKSGYFKDIAATGSNILPLFIGAVIVAYLLF